MHAGSRPDLRVLVVCFTGGVLAVHALASLPESPWVLLLLLPALLHWRGRLPWLALLAGAVLALVSARSVLEQRWPSARHGENHWIEGTVASLPESEGGDGQVASTRFLFAPKSNEFPSRIRVAWYRGESPVRGGDCWRFLLRLRTPHGSLNPDAFDYEGWLFRQGIGATATVRDAQPCERSAGGLILRWRQQLVDAVSAALPPSNARAMVLALTVGDRSGFRNHDWDVFRATGTTHLVAISGFNVAIVAGFAFFVFRWLWGLWPRLCLRVPAQRIGLLASAVMALLYALIAGFEAPVARAALMCCLLLAAAWTNRLREPSRVLALAWLAILALDPSAVLSPGLWLSFAAVGAIFYVSLNRLRAPGFWHGAVLLQLMLAVALAPVTLYFFQGASWIAPLVNVVAVPLFALLTPWAFVAVAAQLLWPPLGAPLLHSLAWALDGVIRLLELAASAPGLWLPASPPAPALALALIGVALLFLPRGVPLRPLGALCLLPMLLVPATKIRGDLEVAMLDVGQGLAVVVRTRNHALLYDAGPAIEEGFDAGASVVAPYLLGQGLRRLDLLLVSHGDNDHAGGVGAVRELLDVRAEIGTERSTPCMDGMSWTWDGVRFEVLHPGASRYSGNDGSCVLKVTGPYSVLLAGDIEAAAEERLLREHPAALAADLLIAPHHGSRTSSTEEFVRAANPQVVLYSAGWRHHFRHPRPEVLARYQAIGARQYNTASSGALEVWLGTGGIRVDQRRLTSARFWNAAAEPVVVPD